MSALPKHTRMFTAYGNITDRKIITASVLLAVLVGLAISLNPMLSAVFIAISVLCISSLNNFNLLYFLVVLSVLMGNVASIPVGPFGVRLSHLFFGLLFFYTVVQKRNLLKDRFIIFISLFLSVHLLNILFTRSFSPLPTGYFFLLLFLIIAVYVPLNAVVHSMPTLKKTIKYYLIAQVLVAVYGVIFAFIDPKFVQYQIRALDFTSTYYALTIVPAIAMLIAMLLNKFYFWNKMVHLAITIFLFLTLLFTNSRGSLLAIIITAFYLVILSSQRSKIRKLITLSFFAAVFCAIATNIDIYRQRFSPLLRMDIGELHTYDIRRIYFARAAINMFIKNPVFGVGLKQAEAAHLTGKAINITKTTAAHSISYPLTSHFGIPHGQAVCVTLSSLLIFNANVTEEDVHDKRGAGYVKETIDRRDMPASERRRRS